jgi:hypothetical protein
MGNRVSPQSEATGTLEGVFTDLQRLVTWMPVSASQAHAAADILDKLATEVTEAAELLRRT